MTPSGAPAEELVRYQAESAVAYVTMSRPEARNALTFAMYERIEALMDEADRDPAIRAIVLRGSGGHFAAGTDISQFRSFSTAEQAIAYERQQDRIMGHIEAISKPTIAAIEGVAAGGGAMMAVACDLRIMARGASIGIPVARTLGNCLSIRNAQRLVNLIGPARTKQLIFGAALLPAENALTWGLANEVVDDDDLERHVQENAERIARHAPVTLRVTKEEARRIAAANRVPENAADDLVVEAYLSQDFREGVSAFLDKRPPRWQAR
ncbi:MAG: enoyl-CoA hydratase/isomerase family protein [Chloroflexi bacterium]|nr:enoyl-CoA hydratase/isomerase family protein [Chloroflexota bacterium]